MLKQSELYTPALVRAICSSLTNVTTKDFWKARKGRVTQARRKREVLVGDSDENQENEGSIKLAVAKLHTNLGHPSNAALARAIRLTGGSDLAISCALSHKCSVCERLAQPTNAAHMPGSLKQVKDFNEHIAIDLFTLAECHGTNQSFLNCLDLASSFQIVAPVDSKHPRVIWKALLEKWISWAGPPHKLLADNGGEFFKEVTQEAEAMGVEFGNTAALAPTQKCFM